MNHINLVPAQYKRVLRRKKHIIFGIIVSTLVIVGLLFLAFLPIRYIQIYQDEQMVLDQLLKDKELEQVVTLLETIEIIRGQQLDSQQVLDQIDTPSHITRKTMDIIVGNAPKGLRINKLVIQDMEGTINISGKVLGVKSIAAYIVALYGTEEFENISYTTNHHQSLETQDWIDYDLEIQFKPLIYYNGEAS